MGGPFMPFGCNNKYRTLVTPAKRGRGNKPKVLEETCSSCGGTVRFIVRIEDSVVIKKILTHLKEKAASAQSIERHNSRAPPHQQ